MKSVLDIRGIVRGIKKIKYFKPTSKEKEEKNKTN